MKTCGDTSGEYHFREDTKVFDNEVQLCGMFNYRIKQLGHTYFGRAPEQSSSL